jgi:hypothetical protein
LIGALLLSLWTVAAPSEPVIVLADNPVTAETARSALAANGAFVDIVGVAQHATALARTDITLLGLGRESCAHLAAAATSRRACIDQVAPAAQQLALVARGFPGRTRVIVLRDPARRADDEALRGAAAAAGLTLVLVDVASPGEAVPAFVAALRAPGPPSILLALPDTTVLTADTVAPLSQAALSARVPLVGTSGYFLKIGAVAAVVVDGAGAARAALAVARGEGRPPTRVSMLVDGRLAQRLGIPVRAGDGIEVRR